MDVITGALWNSRQRASHSMHEVSYRACFKAELPAYFIERFSQPGDVVLDPFSGRGTTALQAALMGRRAIANDVNPVSSALLSPRLSPPDAGTIAQRLQTMRLPLLPLEFPELLAFYHQDTLAELESWRRHLLANDADGTLDPVDDWLRMVTLNRLTGHSKGFLSGYTLPPNQAASLKAQHRINERHGIQHPYRNLRQVLERKSARLLRDAARPASLEHRLLTGDAAVLDVPTASVDLVVCSPPFLDVVDYAGDNWLRGWFLGTSTAGLGISTPGRLQDWQAFMAGVLGELSRVVRPGGIVAIEVGEVRKGTVTLEQSVVGAAAGLPLQARHLFINAAPFTRTAKVWGVANNDGGTNSNRVVVFKRT